MIRLATIEDIPALGELIPQSVRLLSIGLYTPQQIESALIHVFGVDTQLIIDQTYYVVESEERIVGCGGWSKRRTLYGGDQAKEDGPDTLLDPRTEAARIRAFFVHPEFARQGIGSSIMNACEGAARAAGFTVLELAATLPGVPLYKRFGYHAVEPFEIELPDGVTLPVVRMQKTLLKVSTTPGGA